MNENTINLLFEKIAPRLNWGEDEKAVFTAETTDEEKLDALLSQVESLSTADYWKNNQELQDEVYKRLQAKEYGNIEYFESRMLGKHFADVVRPEEIAEIYRDRDIKHSDKFKKALELIELGLQAKQAGSTDKSEVDEILKGKDSRIAELQQELEAAQQETENNLSQYQRKIEEEKINNWIAQEVRKQTLINPNVASAAVIVAQQALSKYHLQLDESGNVRAMNAQNPALPAQDDSSKTNLDVSQFILSTLDSKGLISRNTGGKLTDGGQTVTGVTDLGGKPSLNDIRAQLIAQGVNPNSDYFKRVVARYEG